MLIVLSPAKSLDFETPPTTRTATTPDFLDRSSMLIEVLRGFSPGALADLMHLSDALAVLNVGRYASWTPDHAEGRQAIMARGMMARYAAVKGITDPEKLKKFDVDGYAFEEGLSTASTWVFRRKIEA